MPKKSKKMSVKKMSVEEENFRLGVSYILFKLDKALKDLEDGADTITFATKIFKIIKEEKKTLNER